jgi:L-asparaginase II
MAVQDSENPVIAEAWRGPLVESRHRGALAVVDSAGNPLLLFGNVDQPIYPRSAIKLLQAVPLVESGVADSLGFGDEELALASASHSGTVRHVEIARRMLERVGLGEDDLACGGHWPLSDTAGRALAVAGGKPGRLHDNCSGKHAGMLCLACQLGEPPSGYETYDHPVQARIRSVIAEFTGIMPTRETTGTDGCSLPNYAIPLRALALGFARIASGERISPARAKAASRLLDACRRQPELVAGKGRFDTEILSLFGPHGPYLKGGAEGVHCIAIPHAGIGIAIKADDGGSRGSDLVAALLLKAFAGPRGEAAEKLAARVERTDLDRRGRPVGVTRPSEALRAAIAARA